MDRALNPEEIEDLLPAYALDAVDDDERAAIEEYLAGSPAARETIAGLQSAASMLAHAGGPPPDGVWERLEVLIAEAPVQLRATPQPAGMFGAASQEPRRTEHRWQWLAAAAAIVALVFAGLWIAERGDGGTAARDTAALARAAEQAPGARRAVLMDPDGNALATAVVLRDGTGYLTPDLPRLRSDRTYQLWGLSKTKTISLGVLGPHPRVVAFKAAGPTEGLAITTEVAGGVPVSRNSPDAVGDIVAS
jgi:hypothetical protein